MKQFPMFKKYIFYLFKLERTYSIVMVLAINQHEVVTGICVCPPPIRDTLPISLPHSPSGLSHSTGSGCPASCMKLAFIIYFTLGNI